MGNKTEKVGCSVQGCGRQVPVVHASVPSIAIMLMGGGSLAELQPRKFAYCGPCVRIGRRLGQQFYSLVSTEERVAAKLAERAAERARRDAIRDAVVKGCTTCGTKVSYRNSQVLSGKRGRHCPRCSQKALAAPAGHDETQGFLRKQEAEALAVPVLATEVVAVATDSLTDKNGNALRGAAKAAAARKRGSVGVLAEHQYASAKTEREAKKLAKRAAKQARREARRTGVEPLFEAVKLSVVPTQAPVEMAQAATA